MIGFRRKHPLLFFAVLLAGTGLACQAITGTPRPTPIPTWTSAPPAAATAQQLPTAAATSVDTPAGPSASPAPQATQTPASALTPSPVQLDSSPQALAACPLSQQTQAVRPEAIPDWNHLGISACYDLSMDLSADGSSYTGSEKLSFTNLTGIPLNELVFRTYPNAPVIYAGKLDVTAARVDGRPVQPEVFLNDHSALRLKLSTPLAPEGTTSVELEFQGQPPTDFNPGGGYGIFERTTLENQQGYVDALANWYPILAQWENGQWIATEVISGGDAVVSVTSLYHVRVQVASGWKVAASGTQIASSGQTFEFVGLVREFTVAASPAFQTRQSTTGDITITHWGLPGTEQGWNRALQIAVNAVNLYNQQFGPYPYKELDVVSLPLKYASGVEYPGLVMIETGQYNSQELVTVIAHEVAHQWWYGVVGSDVLEDPFQDEALATYSELVYEQKYSSVIYQGELTFYRGAVKSVENQQGKQAVDQSVAAFRGNDNAYAVIVYLKGALFFQAVRDQLGDDNFFAALHAYYTRNAFTTANVPALLDAFQQACHCSLDTIYKDYGVEK